jgi:hypothetical protein
MNWQPKNPFLDASSSPEQRDDALQLAFRVSDITVMFRSLPKPSRWSRRTTLSDPSSLRVETVPPSLRCPPMGGPWQRLMFWLLAPAPQHMPPPMNRLPGVRTEFLATISDIDSVDADALRRRILDTHSLRELWHQRAEVYRLVGVAHNQEQAEERVALLNRHFPTRAPRSQLGPL